MPRKKHRLKTHETGTAPRAARRPSPQPAERHEPDAHTSLLLDFEDRDQPYRDRSPASHAATIVGDPHVVTTSR